MNTEPAEWQTYLVTQETASAGRSSKAIVESAIKGGVDVVQLREKDVAARDRYTLGMRLRELTAEAEIPLIVNDRIDLAQAIDADGVHVGQSDLPVGTVRELLPDAIIGCSASTVEAATRAERNGADYLGVGAVYGTTSKAVSQDKSGIGPDRIRELATAVSIPVIGIGGIAPSNARAVVEAGAVGVAVISAITAADDPVEATRALRDVVEDSTGMTPDV